LVENHLDNPDYNPSAMIDSLIAIMNLANDAKLARTLRVSPPLISKVRHRHVSIGAALLIRMHDVTGIEIKRLRKMAGIK
jgi:hypothetical protein